MAARDLTTGQVTEPVNWVENPDYKDKENADPSVPKYLPAEPHIGVNVNADRPEETVQTGYVRGGTTLPPEGVDGGVQQLDNAGKPVDVHPGEIARIVRDEGVKAANKKLGGPQTPPGDPEPASKGSK